MYLQNNENNFVQCEWMFLNPSLLIFIWSVTVGLGTIYNWENSVKTIMGETISLDVFIKEC